MKKSILFIVGVLFMVGFVSGVDYFVDGNNVGQNGCSDSWNGGISDPWCTLERAKRSSGTVLPGDTVYIRGGTYSYTSAQFGIQFNSGDGGNVGAPITYKAYPGQKPIFTTGGTSGLIIIFINAKNLIFDSLSFEQKIPYTKSVRGISMSPQFTENITLINNNFNTSLGIALNGIGLKVINNTFFNNIAPLYIGGNGQGVVLSISQDIVIKNNIFKYTGQGLKINPHYKGDIVEDTEISNNFFYQVGYGIYDVNGGVNPWPQPGIIIDNQCNNCVTGTSDVTNVSIFNNIFWGNSDAGIRTQRSDVKIYNNVFYRNGWPDNSGLQPDSTEIGSGVGVKIERGVHIAEIKNNIFYDNWGSYYTGLEKDINTQHSGGGTYDQSYNHFGNLDGDPLFINGDPETEGPYDVNNYKLAPTSPAIDAGADLTGIVDIDYFGSPRPQGNGFDIGAYEYLSSCTPTLHPADTDCSDTIEIGELLIYINQWKNNEVGVTISTLFDALVIWKKG